MTLLLALIACRNTINHQKAARESYMIHASCQNGHTIQEVSGFHPERLDWEEYERVVREAIWNFGMYYCRIIAG